MDHRTISHYRILDKIGAGGMGEVYLAEDDRLGRKLALKVLPAEWTQDPERTRRFEQEARSASALNHPNIITIYEIGEDKGRRYIATEFIEGETLWSLINSGGLDLDRALDIAIQAAGALQAAHSAGIAHRDIKPDNIMVRRDGYVKVLDFGLAKLTEMESAGPDEDPTRSLFETRQGVVMGTVAYMSPEQARGQRVDTRTDIFSFGIVLYEMLSGRRPFGGETVSDMIVSLLATEPVPVSEHIPGIPLELESLVGRMLVKDREARIQTIQEVAAELRRIRAGLERDSRQTASMPPGATASQVARSSAGAAQPSAYATRVSERAAGQPSAPQSYETSVMGDRSPAGSVRRLIPRSGGMALAMLAVAALLFWGGVRLKSYFGDSRIDSIAVLPFVNQTGDPDAEYLGEGITEEIINTISQLPEISVSSRNSVIRYKGREADAAAVGRELGVKAVLLGRMLRRGENLTINAELVNASNGRQVWGERFDRKVSDLLSLQQEISRSIASKLRLKLSAEQQDQLARGAGTNISEAYDLYLKGRYYWNQGTIESIKKADQYFEAAAGKDPRFAEALSGCAASHAAGCDQVTPKEAMEKAKGGALAALKYDESLANAHLTLAQVNFRYDWDFPSAERQFKRAIELDPRNAGARQMYAEFLALMGRHDEARSEIVAARKLDPMSLPINSDFGRLLYYAGNYDESISQLSRTIELDDNFGPAHADLGMAYEQKGMVQESILERLRAGLLLDSGPERVTRLKAAYTSQGAEGFWTAYIEQLRAESLRRYVPRTDIASAQVRLGDTASAIGELENAFRDREGGLVALKVDPVYNPLRKNPAFEDLVRRIGLAR